MNARRPAETGNGKSGAANGAANDAKKKLEYAKPVFEHERVFETMALACGKVSPTQGSCRFNRKNS